MCTLNKHPFYFQNQNLRKHLKKTGAGPLPMRDQLDSIDLIILDLIGDEPVTGIQGIRRAPVLPGETDMMASPPETKRNSSESNQTLKDSVLTPSLTRRKITYPAETDDKKAKGEKQKSRKKKKKKKKKYADSSEDEVSSTTSDPPFPPDELNTAGTIDLTKSPLAITGKQGLDIKPS